MTSGIKRKITVAGSEHEAFIVEQGVDGFFLIEYDGIPFEIFLGANKQGYRSALIDGIPLAVSRATSSRETFTLLVNGKKILVAFAQDRDLSPPTYVSRSTEAPKLRLPRHELDRVIAHMPGRIVSIKVKLGDSVSVGDPILVLLAMKMENTIVASSTGIVRELHVDVGVTVNKGDLLAVIE